MWMLYILSVFITAAELGNAGRYQSTQRPNRVSQDPSSVQCHDPGVPLVSCVEYKFNETKFEVTAEWKFHYTDQYSETVTCQPNGEWSAPVITNEGGTYERYCKHPLGNLQDHYKIGFQWPRGGTEKFTCMDDGKWAGNVPTCKSDRHRLVNKNDTSCPNILGEGECHKPGEKVSAGSCGEADSEFTCGKHGKWIGKIPTCEGEHFEWHKFQLLTPAFCVHKSNSEGRACISAGLRAPAFANSSPLGSFPWQAALASIVDDSRKGSYNGWFIYCGGALVSNKWVLTAAHCLTVTPSSRVLRSVENISVFLGKHHRNNDLDDEHVKNIKAKKIMYHPTFDPASFNDDIGLLELEIEVQFTDRIRPICLPQLGTTTPMTEEQPERHAVVAGWGINHLNEPNEALGHVFVKHANLAECKVGGNTDQKLFFCGGPYTCTKYCFIYSGNSEKNYFIANAAGDGWTCPGDSGGPLIFQEMNDGLKRFVVEGLVSHGQNHCVDAKTSYIKVRPYLCWIKDIIKNDIIMGDSRIPKVQSTCNH